jgi:hypothetical protein
VSGEIIKFPSHPIERKERKVKRTLRKLRIQDFLDNPQRVHASKIYEIVNKFKKDKRWEETDILWSIWCTGCGEAMCFEKPEDVIDFLEFHTTYCTDFFYFEILW